MKKESGDKKAYNSLDVIVEKYGHPDDIDINESLVRALEGEDNIDRRIAVESLVALNDLHAAGRVYWLVENGSEQTRLAVVEVLGSLCNDSSFILDILARVHVLDKSGRVRLAAVEALEKNGYLITIKPE